MKKKYLEQIQLGIKCTNSYWSSKETLSKLEKSSTLAENQPYGLLFIEKTRYDFWRLFFYIQDISKINWSIFKGKELVAEMLVRNSKKEKWETIVQEFQEKGGFKLYDSFIRLYREKLDVDVNGVDFSITETPNEEDLLSIHQLLEANFDPYCDRIPSLEELRSLAQTTYVIKDKGKVVALFITQKSGITLIFRYWLVLENYRGRKFGDVLLKRVLTFDPEIKRVTSWISQKLDYSILAHKRLGFKEEGLTNYILYRE